MKVISKKYADTVLELLNKKGELYFGQILRETGINPRNLSDLLKELEKEGLVKKDERIDGNTKHLKKFYSITPLGKKVLILMKAINMLKSNPNIDVYTEDNKIIVSI